MRYLYSLLLFMIFIAYLRSDQINPNWDVSSYYKVAPEEVNDFGLEVDEQGRLSFYEGESENFKKFRMNDLLIDSEEDSDLDEEDYVGYSPRFATMDFEQGSVVYFRDLNDFKSSENEAAYQNADDLICLQIDWIDGKMIRLWYEPCDLLNEELSKIPEQKKEIEGIQTDVDNQPNFEFKLYPNPVVGEQFTIEVSSESNETLQIKIYDMRGNERQFDQPTNRFNQGTTTMQLGISNLESGMYLIQVKSTTGVATKRLIIAK
jgi:hypothetical protein